MNRNRQKGVSLIGLLIVGGLLGFVLLLGFKSVPVFNENMAVKRVIKQMVTEGGGGSVTQLQRDFDTKASIDDISSISGKDLEISKEAGGLVIRVDYERRVAIGGNVFLLYVFNVDSREL